MKMRNKNKEIFDLALLITECNFFFTARCVAGHFSPTGLERSGDQCQPCPIGTYNNVNGSTECEACPQGTTTLASGADSDSKCVGKSYEEICLRTICVSSLYAECFEKLLL